MSNHLIQRLVCHVWLYFHHRLNAPIARVGSRTHATKAPHFAIKRAKLLNMTALLSFLAKNHIVLRNPWQRSGGYHYPVRGEQAGDLQRVAGDMRAVGGNLRRVTSRELSRYSR
jgi:hypothetical protein